MTIRGEEFGARFADATFESFEKTPGNDAALEAAIELVAQGTQGRGLIIQGKEGLGKSHLLVAIAKAFDARYSFHPKADTPTRNVRVPDIRKLIHESRGSEEIDVDGPTLSGDEIDRDARVVYWTIPVLIQRLRADAANYTSTTADQCQVCDLLLLDDLGLGQQVSPFIVGEIERIIDYRYRHLKPIGLTSNKALADAVVETFGSRIYSRLREMCDIVDVVGEDYRLKAAR